MGKSRTLRSAGFGARCQTCRKPSQRRRRNRRAAPILRSAADVNHRSRRLQEARLADMMPRLLALNGTKYVSVQLLVVRARSHASIQVVFHLRKQTSAYLAVGSQPHPAARSAKRLGDGRNNAYLTDTVRKGIAARRLAGVAGRQRDQREHLPDPLHNFTQWHHDLRRPEPAFFQWHELDEAYHNVFIAREPGESFNLVVIESAQQHAV